MGSGGCSCTKNLKPNCNCKANLLFLLAVANNTYQFLDSCKAAGQKEMEHGAHAGGAGRQCTFRASPRSTRCASCPSHPSTPEPHLTAPPVEWNFSSSDVISRLASVWDEATTARDTTSVLTRAPLCIVPLSQVKFPPVDQCIVSLSRVKFPPVKQ